jgi:hypothetical protein
MTTNNFPGIGYKTQGFSFDFFELITVSATTFGGNSVSGQQPDLIVPFPTAGFSLINYGTTGQAVEYSFNGNTVSGELVPGTASASLQFDNRAASLMWFRLKSGSTGSPVIRVEAWGQNSDG